MNNIKIYKYQALKLLEGDTSIYECLDPKVVDILKHTLYCISELKYLYKVYVLDISRDRLINLSLELLYTVINCINSGDTYMLKEKVSILENSIINNYSEVDKELQLCR